MSLPGGVDVFGWRPEQFGEALQHLARHAGLARADAAVADTPPPATNMADLTRWMDWAVDRLGAETETVDVTVGDIDAVLRSAGPALVQVATAAGPRVLALVGSRFGRVRLLCPDLRIRSYARTALGSLACEAHAAPHTAAIDRLLDVSGVPPRRAARVRDLLTRERVAGVVVARVWIIRVHAAASLWAQLRDAGIPRRLATMLTLFAATYALEILAWQIIGSAALDGRLDLGWLHGWTLLVLSVIPLRLVGSWLDASLTLDVSRIVKTRLLAGALHLDADVVRRQGAGHLLARVMESQAFEAMALSLGIGSFVALVELGFAGAVLSAGAAPRIHLGLMLGCLGLTVASSLRYVRVLGRWAAHRLDLAHDLVERMVGHRTTLAQEPAARRDREQDRSLDTYHQLSTELDAAALPFMAGLPNGWLLLGLAGLVPAFVSHEGTPAAFAISVGGVLLASRAFTGIVSGLASAAGAFVAWRQVGPLFDMAPREDAPVFIARRDVDPRGATPVVDADRLSYAYAGQDPVLRQASITVARGDKVLIEGASGGGKSTLASLVVGLRRPTSGLLLLDGLDRFTRGASWHHDVASAPQFHENHVLTGSLGFNLLMGRNWPATDSELADAEGVCRELGLSHLLDRMPAGLMQTVGETGWQLSHGERSRLFLARALLQGSELTVLDESFAALDPESLETCLDTVLRRTNTLAVIAHP